ncbi:CpcT/CpeT family chromophore lyase [Glycocaulis sp.]|uniref:CpcT/CpeT family chromophore lyase n=1 Tax=Glycocaulis sp. TaxID=1969725 RepID=UPI003D22311F
MIALLLAALAFTEPETAPEAQAEPIYGSAAYRASFLTGRFSNTQQYEAWQRDAQPDAPAYELDLYYATHARVEAPELGEHVIYVEWRSGAADGPVSRQRLWVFREGEEGWSLGFDILEFRDPETFAGRADEEGAFASLTAEDLIGYPEACVVATQSPAHAGYYFTIESDDCIVTAESGEEVRMGASLRGDHHFFTYREWANTLEHQPAYRFPDAPYPYSFRLLPDED